MRSLLVHPTPATTTATSPRRWMFAGALALFAVACTSTAPAPAESAASRSSASARPTARANTTPASAKHVDAPEPAAGAKKPLAGLVDMQSIAWHNADDEEPTFVIDNVAKFPGVFGGIVVNATWRALQPSEGGALDTKTIDEALAKVRAYNAANPNAPIGVKLRVYAGSSAPDWAKRIGGGPVHIERNPKGCAKAPCKLTVGKYWSDDYIASWRKFQTLLATKYDAEPLIRQVAVTSCAPQTDEPFVPTTEKASKAALEAAGYSDVAEKRCLTGAIDDYAPWKMTLVDYTINTFTKVAGGTDTSFPETVMQHCRDVFGARCVLDNHALSAPLRETDHDVYDAMARMKGVINFQTEAPRGLGCEWRATIAQGVALGATSIEVWPDAKYQGFTSLTEANVRELASEFTSPIAVPKTGAHDDACTGFH